MAYMVGGQELLANQIAGDLGHERAWNLGEKKEDEEEVPFYLLLALTMYHGGQTSTVQNVIMYNCILQKNKKNRGNSRPKPVS